MANASGYRVTASDGRALLSAAGQELLSRLAGIDVSPEAALALSASLRAEYPADLVAAALTQQALRVAGRAKFSRADQMLFTRAGLEQASSELTARHAAIRFADARTVADLCCGIGGNLLALAGADADDAGSDARRVIGVDSDPASLEFARHNVSVYAGGLAGSSPLTSTATSAKAAFVCADVREFRLSGIDAVFIDPARRVGQRRLPAGQYVPPLSWCLRLAESVRAVGIKAAPGLRRDLVPPGWETEFVAVGRELKEALLWSPALAGPVSRATVLPSGDTLTSGAGACADPTPLAAPGAFLFDPNPAVTRSGLVAALASQLEAWQIDPMIAFLSADEPKLTPFARTLRVVESAPWHEKRFAARLRELGIGAADIRRRGLAGDVERIHRRLGLRGPGTAVLVLTRVANHPWGLICTPHP
jgi:SAM-dependent methyltransferase